jgi:hypothetical protein
MSDIVVFNPEGVQRLTVNGRPKADKKRLHREKKHAIINERIAFLRGKYTGMTAAQRAAEARVFADRKLADERRNEVGA